MTIECRQPFLYPLVQVQYLSVSVPFGVSLQTGDMLPAFPTPDTANDPWWPLHFDNPTAWRDAVAEDMWREYVATGQYVEAVTPYQRAQRRQMLPRVKRKVDLV